MRVDLAAGPLLGRLTDRRPGRVLRAGPEFPEAWLRESGRLGRVRLSIVYVLELGRRQKPDGLRLLLSAAHPTQQAGVRFDC